MKDVDCIPCECLGWAQLGGWVLTTHHRNCKDYNAQEEIYLLEEKLRKYHELFEIQNKELNFYRQHSQR